jgi:HD-like signal output (HDOD) protein
MDREYIKRRVESIDRLPIAPRVTSVLFRDFEGHGQTPGALAALVSSDVALAAHVMRVAGGAQGRSGTPVSTITDAVLRLGLGSAQSVVRLASAAPQPSILDSRAQEFDAVAAHSVACAIWTECIAEKLQSEFQSLA